MTDLATISNRLRATPTAGVSSEYSGWFRRLVSAGYKGHIQGLIGGATLYGTMGLVVGAIAAPIAAIAGIATGTALLLLPILAGIGALHGAHTFSTIGSTAAIIAEDSETSEKRRNLLDRLQDKSIGQEEKLEIKKLLDATTESKKPEKIFHWKTVLVGAALGAGAAIGLALIAAAAGLPVISMVLGESAAHLLGGGVVETLAATALVGSIGAAAGGLIGLDREYVRRWLDGASGIVNDPSHAQEESAQREHEVGKIVQAARRDQTQPAFFAAATDQQKSLEQSNALAASQPPLPSAQVSNVTSQNRLLAQEKAIGA